MRASPSIALTALAMLAFAANSVLCRLALEDTRIDPASFTTIRILSGALTLWLLLRVQQAAKPASANWPSTIALFLYAIAFSFAYVSIATGAGALLLFGAVQATMIAWGLWQGERMNLLQTGGLVLALGGLVALLLPGASAPPLGGAALMLGAGIAWGVYSLRGRRGGADPLTATAGNFLRAVPLAVVVSVLLLPWASLDTAGVVYAVLSGAVASGLGYAIWYSVLPALRATQAATVQLSVPIIAALGGVLLLAEPITWRLTLTSVAVLGGIALVLRAGTQTPPAPPARR